jgi:hypothetical protein
MTAIARRGHGKGSVYRDAPSARILQFAAEHDIEPEAGG